MISCVILMIVSPLFFFPPVDTLVLVELYVIMFIFDTYFRFVGMTNVNKFCVLKLCVDIADYYSNSY